MAAIAALLTSVLVFRMRGGYFAIGTWVLAEVFRIGFSNVSIAGRWLRPEFDSHGAHRPQHA